MVNSVSVIAIPDLSKRVEDSGQNPAVLEKVVSRDYAPMTEVFRDVIARTLRSAARASSA